MNCKNCDATLSGNFCANCGQKADIHRITFKHFLHEFFHAFTHTDKGILLLMKALVTRPGYVAREYLDGKRKKYFNPLSFLVIITSIYAYISFKSGYFQALTVNSMNTSREGRSINGTVARLIMESFELSNNNGRVIALFLTPVLISLFSWLFFIRSKNNLSENLVLNSFLMSQFNIIMIVIFIPLFVFVPAIPVKINNDIFHGLMWIYMTVAYKQFFRNNIFLTALKSLLIIILFIIFFWICLFGFVVVKDLFLG